MRAASAAERPLGVWRLLALVPVCLFVAYAGNALGLLVMAALGRLLAALPHLPDIHAPLMGLTGNVTWLETALLVVAAPALEEFVFRRCLISRLAPHGERAALVVSSALFALFHETANQCVYAFLLGLVFGYVYLRCGRIRYTLALHMGVNALGAIVVPALVGTVAARMADVGGMAAASMPATPETMLLVAYLALLAVLVAAGFVLFCHLVREHDVRWGGISIGRAITSTGICAFLVVALYGLACADAGLIW